MNDVSSVRQVYLLGYAMVGMVYYGMVVAVPYHRTYCTYNTMVGVPYPKLPGH